MNQQKELELNLIDLFFHLKKQIWIIVAVSIVFGIAGFCAGAFVIEPEYTASTRMYVLNRTNASAVVYADIQTSTYLSNDYKVLITGENVTDVVISRLGLDVSSQKLASWISVTVPDSTRVLQISVTHTDPQMAADIANAVREAASSEITRIMAVDAVNLVYEAKVPEKPSSPGAMRYALIAAVLGFVAAVGILGILFVLDDTIRTEEDVERYLGISTLGVIPMSVELNAPVHRSSRRK